LYIIIAPRTIWRLMDAVSRQDDEFCSFMGHLQIGITWWRRLIPVSKSLVAKFGC